MDRMNRVMLEMCLLLSFLAGTLDAWGDSFLYTGGTFSTIRVPWASASDTFARGINDTGQIVGYYWYGANRQGFVDNAGTFSTISVPGVGSTEATGINNAGQIVGIYCCAPSFPQGFVDNAGTFSTISVPGAFITEAFGINNAGQIVGDYQTPAGVSGSWIMQAPSAPSAFLGHSGQQRLLESMTPGKSWALLPLSPRLYCCSSSS